MVLRSYTSIRRFSRVYPDGFKEKSLNPNLQWSVWRASSHELVVMLSGSDNIFLPRYFDVKAVNV